MVTYYSAVPLYYAMFGVVGMDGVISELCYKGTILQSNYYNYSVKFDGN